MGLDGLAEFVVGWQPVIWPTLILLAYLYVPGAVLLWLSGASASLSLVLAPLLATAVGGGSAIVFAKTGIPWGAPTFLSVFVVLAVLVLACRAVHARGIPRFQRPSRVAGGTVLVGCVALLANFAVVAVRYMQANVSASAVSYEYDTIWHFSVIRWILDHHNASSVDVGLLDGTSGNHFYPAAWHGLVALTASSTGADVAVAVQASVLAVLLVVWPVSIAALTRRLFGRSRVAEGAVAACAYLPAVYPVGFLEFGVLYSNFYSYALIPAGIIVCHRILLMLQDRRSVDGSLPGASVVLATIAIPIAMACAQPNSAFVVLVVILPAVYVTLDHVVRRIGRRHTWWLRVLAHGVFTVLLVAGWCVVHDSSFLSRTISVDWYKYTGYKWAAWQWVFFGNSTTGQVILGAVVLIGVIWVLWKGPSRWFVVSYGLLGVLFVVCASFEGGPGSLRDYLVGFWYHDSPRLAATAAIVGLPFVGYAISRTATLAQAWLGTRHPSAFSRFGGDTVALALVAVVLVTTAFGSAQSGRSASLREQAEQTDGQWLSPAEEDFLAEAADIVGDDAVANNPFDGSAMGYSLIGINMVFKALPGNWMGTATDDQNLLMESFNTIADDPQVCSVAQQENIGYVVVLRHGERGVFQDDPGEFPGLSVTPETPGFELVAQSEADGALQLYRVLPCAATGE